MRRALGLGAIAVLLLGLVVGGAFAAAPEGPRLAFTRWGSKPFKLELLSVGPSSSGLQRIAGGAKPALTHGPVPFQGPTWSPDGSLIAFSGYFRPDKWEIFVAAPDGSELRAIPGTTKGLNPVFAPDGRTIAFARSRIHTPRIDIHHPLQSLHGGYASTTTWTVGVDGGGLRRLTRWRNGLHNQPSSFSPDGSTLALSRNGPRGHEAVALHLDNGRVAVLARNAEEPAYSPDGTRIAFVSYRDRNVDPKGGFDGPASASELYVRNLDGTGLTQITRTHNRQEQSPSWDPSGQRIAYTQTTAPELFALGFTSVVMEVNADGTCLTRVFGKPTKRGADLSVGVGLYGPAWQPGPGREAGRIAC